MKKPVLSADQAVLLIKDEMTLAISSFMGYALPESLCKALERRYDTTGSPKNITLYYPSPVGLPDGSGVNRLAREGLLKRVITSHWNLTPALGKMALDNCFEAYTIPLGVLSRISRDMAAKGPGIFTHVGLGTYVDPRIEGGRVNNKTTKDLVSVVKLNGKEYLHYQMPTPDIVFLRGTYADRAGNVSVELEGVDVDVTALAQAVHNHGGQVVVQVGNIVNTGTLDPWKVKIPGSLVDALVLPDESRDHMQNHTTEFNGAICGMCRASLTESHFASLDARKIIGRRAVMELKRGSVVNLGIGVPESVAQVAEEEGLTSAMTLTVESGATGGVPCSGGAFGASVNVDAILTQAAQFDFYDGGGIDQAYLGMAQADRHGNVNVSYFDGRLAGCGGFIDIAQNAKAVIFCGTFTAGGLKVAAGDGILQIAQEGKSRKFIETAEQITFAADYARQLHQKVIYITERAVFVLVEEGLMLTEIAPGVDLNHDILPHMAFQPLISKELKIMDERIFRTEKMGIVL